MDSLALFFEKHKIAFIAFVSAIFIISTSSLAYAELKKDITITIENDQKKLTTFRSTVGEVLEDQHITVGPGDILNKGTEEKIKDDLEITLNRQKKVEPIVLQTKRVFEKDFSRLAAVLPKKDPVLVVEKNEVKKIKLAYSTQVIPNPKLEKGITKIVQKGKPGEKKITLRVTYENGKVVSRKIAAISITKNPVNTVAMQGTKNHISTSRGGRMMFTRAFEANASAYWAGSCGKKKGAGGYGRTASGKKVKKGIVAVDPRVIPLGTWLYIEGYGVALAADTGSAIKGRTVDVAFESEEQCMNFGRKAVKVYILDRPRFSF